MRSDEEKAGVKKRKQEVQEKFRKEMGLIVDKPKPGFSSSNDGNTAQKFFKTPQESSGITGVEVRLINNLGVLLRTLSCDHSINIDKFQQFCSLTKDLYLSLYSWFNMSVLGD